LEALILREIYIPLKSKRCLQNTVKIQGYWETDLTKFSKPRSALGCNNRKLNRNYNIVLVLHLG